MIKNFRMNWETEKHTYTFKTGSCRISSLDMLGDLMGSLESLYEKIANEYSYEDNLPKEFKVTAGCGWSHVEGKEHG